jgi:hypothetical protein
LQSVAICRNLSQSVARWWGWRRSCPTRSCWDTRPASSRRCAFRRTIQTHHPMRFQTHPMRIQTHPMRIQTHHPDTSSQAHSDASSHAHSNASSHAHPDTSSHPCSPRPTPPRRTCLCSRSTGSPCRCVRLHIKHAVVSLHRGRPVQEERVSQCSETTYKTHRPADRPPRAEPGRRVHRPHSQRLSSNGSVARTWATCTA